MAAAKPEVELDRLITAKEVAKRLGVSGGWVYHRKDLPFEVRLGTVRRFSESGLAEFIRKLKHLKNSMKVLR
jgi:predicted DNA-binding transcriptional regulator AlpA